MSVAVSPPGSAVELQSLLAKLDQSTPASYALASELLAFLAAQHIHAPKLVVKYGKQLILHHRGKLGDRVWDMYERVFIAALDIHDDLTINVSQQRHTTYGAALAQACVHWCLESLLHQFGNKGLRMTRLLGLHCEYKQRYDEAAEHYNTILAADPTNIAAHKRQIALAKARNNTEQAIQLLSRYTKLFASDESGWSELSLLYVQQQAWELAAFCYEELLLLVPEHPLYHCRYAELLYAQAKYELARQYFAQSVELKPHNNLRALYGILMCLRLRPSSSHAALYAWTMDKLVNHYTKYAPHMLPIVRQSLELTITADSSPTLKLTSTSSPKSASTTVATKPSTTSSASTSTPSATVTPSLPSTSASSSTTTTTTSSSSPLSAASTAVPTSSLSTTGVLITEADGTPAKKVADKSVEELSSVLSTTGLRERTVGGGTAGKADE